MGKIAKVTGYAVLVLVAIGLVRYVLPERTPERDRCKELATTELVYRTAPSILSQTGNFGENIKSVIKECQYFAQEDTLIMAVAIGWNGPFTGDYYQADGRLTIRPPDKWEWKTTGMNDNLKGWEVLKGLAGVIGEQLSSAGADSAGYRFRFHNECRRPVRVVIHFKDLRNAWRTAGWWDFSPRERAILRGADKVELRTNNSVWYYYAESTDGSGLSWRGEHPVQYQDRWLHMKEAKDEEGDSEWAVSCG
jgi:hypothetical protein